MDGCGARVCEWGVGAAVSLVSGAEYEPVRLESVGDGMFCGYGDASAET